MAENEDQPKAADTAAEPAKKAAAPKAAAPKAAAPKGDNKAPAKVATKTASKAPARKAPAAVDTKKVEIVRKASVLKKTATATSGDEPKSMAEALSAAPAKATSKVIDTSKPRVDAQGRAYATGKRKNAIARVWLKSGSGEMKINGRSLAQYFGRATQQMMVEQPFGVIASQGKYDVMVTVLGGGLSGQAGAIRHGVSKALTYYDPALRPPLKKAGLLTRDPRVVERKKYGLAKARRSFQWAKR